MEETTDGDLDYSYIKRQRGLSVCHKNTDLPQVDNKHDIRTLPSILIQTGDHQNIDEEEFSMAREKVCVTYDWTHLNPSNTLDAAVAQNNSRLLEKLLTSAANISLEGPNASGGTPMHEAAYQGKLSCLRVFLKFGADVNLRDREGWTPLHAAICGGDVNSVFLLLKYGACINAAANDGIKPIDMALQTDDQQITQAILCYSKENCSREKEGNAPLASEDFGADLGL